MDYFLAASQNSLASSSVANNSTEKKKGVKKSKGVKLSTDPQSVAARQRRHRISDRFKILQSLVPGGTKMDTVSMLEEAIHYVKFLKTQIWLHQTMINFMDEDPSMSFPSPVPSQQALYSHHNVVAAVQPLASPSLPFPDSSCLQGGEVIYLNNAHTNY